MDNENNGPIIPAGTEKMYNSVYNPMTGQPAVSPTNDKPAEQAPQTGEENAPTGTTFDELAAKKGFKSPEDLAKAYMNLEAQNTKVTMSLADLAKSRDDAQTHIANESSQNVRVETQDDAMKVVENIVRKATRPLEDKLALQDLLLRNPDVKDYASEMAKVVKDNPGVTWETAYKAAKFDALQRTSVEKGRQEAYQTMQQKQSVNVAPARPKASNQQSLENLVKDRSIPFKELQKIMRERFNK